MNNNSSLSFKNIFKREMKLATYIVICMTIVVLSISYALFFDVSDHTNNQVVEAGDLKFTYENGNEIVSSTNKICFEPMSEDEANLYWHECSYKFSVTNTGTLKASYTIGLSPLDGNQILGSVLKVILREENGAEVSMQEVYSEPMNDNGTLTMLDNLELGAKETKVYQVQIYVDETTYQTNCINGDADNCVNKTVAYQINGTGVVHEDNDINPPKPEDGGG